MRRLSQTFGFIGFCACTWALLATGCQERKQRPHAVIKPSSAAPGGPKSDSDPTKNPPGGPVASDAEAAADYLTPVKRPARIIDNAGKERATNDHDVFVTPVYLKSSAWFKSCVIGAVGTSPERLFGCTHADAVRLPKEEPLKLRTSYGVPVDAGDQTFAFSLWSFSPEVKKCEDLPDQKSKSSTGSCPGEMAQAPFAKRLTSNAKEHFLCTRSGSTLIIAYEDQSDGPSAGGEASLFAKYKEAKANLTLEGSGAKAWVFPDVRKLFASETTNAQFKDTKGGVVLEQDLRQKYGVDFVDVIVQIDLGTSGNKLAGFEDCQ
jgi:hypothetical protein